MTPLALSPAELFLQALLNGLALGSVFALIALGYTMVYGIIELINFAHGDLYMLGGFFALTAVALLGLSAATPPGLLALALAGILAATMAFTASVNWAIDRLAYRPQRRAPKLAVLVSAIGVSFILQNLGLFWGGLPLDVMGTNAVSPKTFPELLPRDNLLAALGITDRIQLTVKDAVVLGVTLPLLAALHGFVNRTRFGTAMRATAQDPAAARLMGVDTERVIGITFLLGGALAGAAGMVTCLYTNTVHFQSGYTAGLMAFTAAVLGGIGNLAGAVLGGLLIGLISSFSNTYGSAQWTQAVVFGILIAILVFRPAGLLGSTARQKV
jgi:branched-chain amino acid transport system permease protein